MWVALCKIIVLIVIVLFWVQLSQQVHKIKPMQFGLCLYFVNVQYDGHIIMENMCSCLLCYCDLWLNIESIIEIECKRVFSLHKWTLHIICHYFSQVSKPINATEDYIKAHSKTFKYVVLGLLGAGNIKVFSFVLQSVAVCLCWMIFLLKTITRKE